MAQPTEKELEVLKEFRLRLNDLDELQNATDLYMLRWLRARELNLDASETLLRNHLVWRKDEDMDHILEWEPPDHFATCCNYQICGRDKEGHPILIVPFGSWDTRRVLGGGPSMRAAWLRNFDQMLNRTLDKMKAASAEFGKEITQLVFIVDFANFSMRQITVISTLSVMMEAVRRFESNYPEILFSLYAINAFRLFRVFFGIMKPFLSATTLGKLEIYTTPDTWLPVFKSRLPLDQLPAELGGIQISRDVSIGNGVAEGEILAEAGHKEIMGSAPNG